MDAETATYWLGWVKFGQLVAFFLVAIGVAAEFAGEWASRPLEKIIDDARELEMEHLKRVTTPRVNLLTPEALTSIIEKIKPFHGTKFDIGHAQTGHEQWDFLWQLEPIFPKAGWEFVNWVGPQTFSKSNWTMQPHVYGIAKVSSSSTRKNEPSYCQLPRHLLRLLMTSALPPEWQATPLAAPAQQATLSTSWWG